MPKQRSVRRTATNGGPGGSGPSGREPGTTGRYIVLLKEGATSAGSKALSSVGGLRVASSSDFKEGAVALEQLETGGAIVFDKLGVAVVDSMPEAISSLSATLENDSPILAIEAERVVYATQEGAHPLAGELAEGALGVTVEYLQGYRDAVDHLVDRIIDGHTAGTAGVVSAAAFSETNFTWGLQATRASVSAFSGKKIRVAVLDTGMDLGHPDFANRKIVSKSFVPNQAVQDGHGHGTHCIGTSCGPKAPSQLPRYGIAFGAEIFAGKVLSNGGSGGDGGILAGINWAITNRCAVVSMSLGAPVQPGQAFSPIFEQVAQRALNAGTLIVAAAGNDSRRPALIAPVEHPANCPSIMAVAAIDSSFRVAPFSCGGINPQGGQVDIAGPGVAVRSSWPRPLLFRTISGTSMATPHVAGIAALFAESNPGARGRALWSLLVQHARRLSLPSRDVGSGLVQAP